MHHGGLLPILKVPTSHAIRAAVSPGSPQSLIHAGISCFNRPVILGTSPEVCIIRALHLQLRTNMHHDVRDVRDVGETLTTTEH